MLMKINTNTVNISQNQLIRKNMLQSISTGLEHLKKHRLAYTRNTEKLISEIKLDHGLLLCDDVNCQDPAHKCAINRLYDDIIDALQTAGSFLLETKNLRFKQIPGWNDLCTELHREARSAFLYGELMGSLVQDYLCSYEINKS